MTSLFYLILCVFICSFLFEVDGEEVLFQLKEKLSIAYKSIAIMGMDDLTYTHISARLPLSDVFLIAPFGLLFEEVTPESLLEVSILTGDILNHQNSNPNPTGYSIHSNIYKARSDVTSIFHLHTTATIAVSAFERGLLPISQHALHFYDRVAYHTYDSLALHEHIGAAMVRDLGNLNVMLLRNHGSVTCGSSVEEAFFFMHHLEQAARAQVAAMAMAKGSSRSSSSSSSSSSANNRSIRSIPVDGGEEEQEASEGEGGGGAWAGLVLPSREVATHTREVLLAFEARLGERDFAAMRRRVQRQEALVRGPVCVCVGVGVGVDQGGSSSSSSSSSSSQSDR